MRHLATALSLLAASTTLPRAALAQSRAQSIDSIFRAYSTATPGCGVAVDAPNGVAERRAYGMADLEHAAPFDTATVTEAGSVSKQVTAASIVLLALDGKLSLDDDVRRHVPELPDYGTRLTIRHLLNHTSGLRDWGSVSGIIGWPRETRVYTNDLALDIIRRQRALNYTPGAYYSYTNSGFSLLAIIVGRVSGMPLARFTRERLFAPLGMTRTSWRDDFRRVVPHRAVAYAPRGGGVFAQEMPFEDTYGHGGLLTTPGDLLRWTANLATGAVIGGPRFVDEMHRQARLTSGRTISYASGLFVTSYRGLPEVSHSGATAGYRAFLARYPRHGVSVAVLCNVANANATLLAHRVADLYLPAAASVAAGRGAAGDTTAGRAAPRAESVAGLYRSVRDGQPFRLVATNGELRSGATRLVALDATRWRAGEAMLLFDPPSRAGARAAFRLLAADGDTVRYEPAAPFAPTPAQLASYAGTYASDEADGRLVVSVAGDTLRLRDAYGRELVPLTPLYRDGRADTFDAEGSRVRFLRDAAGRVTSLSVAESRVWDLRFTRRDAR